MVQGATCQLIEEYADPAKERVSSSDPDAFAHHLEECPVCQDYVQRLDQNSELLREIRSAALRLAPVEESFDRLMNRIDNSLLNEFQETRTLNTDLQTPNGGERRPNEESSPTDPLAQLKEDDVLGQYRILRELGRGGMGVVYLANDTQLNRRVALKVMLPQVAANPKAKQRFLREARAIAAVEHEHVVPIFQVGEEAGVPFIAMPFLSGMSLESRLRSQEGSPSGSVPIPEVLRLGKEIAEGLAAAHACGVIHRDIKPANLWLEGAKGKIRILDFGLARNFERSDDCTYAGIAGTPAFMAPEQARGNAVDHRADLFSLGCVLYQLSTGKRPFRGSDPMAVIAAVAADHPVPSRDLNPAIPEALASLIKRLLAKDPRQRPSGAAEVAEELNRIAATVTPPAEKPAPKKRRLTPARMLIAAGIAGILIAAAQYVLNLSTPMGRFVLRTDDPNLEVTIKQNGIVLYDKSRDREFEVRPGKIHVEVFEKTGGFKTTTREFSIVRGGKEIFYLGPPPKELAEPAPHNPKPSLPPTLKLPEKVAPLPEPPLVTPRTPIRPDDPSDWSVNDFTVGWKGMRYALALPRTESQNHQVIRWSATRREWRDGDGIGVRVVADHENNSWILNSSGEIWQGTVIRWKNQRQKGPAIDFAFSPAGKVFALGGRKVGDNWVLHQEKWHDDPDLDVHERMTFVPHPENLRGVRLAFRPVGKGGAIVTLRANGEVHHHLTHLNGDLRAIDIATNGKGEVYALSPEKDDAGEHFLYRYAGDFDTDHCWERILDFNGTRIIGDEADGLWLLNQRGQLFHYPFPF